MTLHEAIERVLIEHGRPMTTREIVHAIVERDLYERQDEEALSTSQIAARVNSYPELFDKLGDEVFLRNKSADSLLRLLFHISDRVRSKTIYNLDLVLGYLLFYFRTSGTHLGEKYYSRYFFNRYCDFEYYDGDDLRSRILESVRQLTSHIDFSDSEEELISTFNKLPKTNLIEIVRELQYFDFEDNLLSDKDFADTFNKFLNSFSGWGRETGESFTPGVVSKYISSLISIRPGETLCDPFAGNTGLACELLKSQRETFSVLQDINAVSVILGKMNLVLHGILNVEYNRGNSIDLYATRLEGRQFDYVVTHPPFGIRYRTDDLLKFPVNFLTGSRGENIHIQLALHLLHPYGKAIILIPDGFLFTNDNSSKEIKRMLLDNDWIESIHALPSGSFKPYSSVNTSLLILNKNKSDYQKGKIIFKQVTEKELSNIKDSEYVSKMVLEPDGIYQKNGNNTVVVEIEKIFQNDLLLNANRYLNEIELGPEYETLESILRNYSTGVVISKKYLDSREGIPFITIKDLADSEIDFVLSSNEISTFVEKMSLVRDNALVREGAVLVAKVGNKLKPTVFSPFLPSSSAAFSSNIIALYPEETIISKEYLVCQLNQPYFKKQLDQIRAGTAQVFLQLKDLLRLRVKVPPLVEQEKELLKNYRAKDLSRRFSKIDREQVEEETQGSLISAIKHEFSNLQVLLDGGITSLKLFIDRKDKEGNPISWNDKIVNLPDARTIFQVIIEQESVLREMGNLFVDMQSLVNLKRSSIKRERVELKGFFKEQVDQMNSQLAGVNIFYELSEKQKKDKYITMLDKSLFSKVVKNFLINSVKHGFERDVVDDKIILFDFAVSDDELWIEITMMNNGKKLPEGFSLEDFISFGGKSGTSRGAGIGGYLMNRAVQLHDGTLDLEEFPEGTVLYITSPHSPVGKNSVVVLSKAFIPGAAFKIRLPYKD
jgi:type I restriction-modification system DNA methylase subunit